MRSTLAADASPSDPDVLRTLYSVLLKTRLLQDEVISLIRAGRIPGTVVPLLGGEATEVGSCIGLQSDDSFSSTQPKLATAVVRGVPLDQIFQQLLRVAEEDSAAVIHAPECFQIVPQTLSITGQLDIAAGIALAYRNLAKANVVVALVDDGLAALGSWHEAADLASRYRLPLVVIAENPSNPRSNRDGTVGHGEDLRDRADAYGFPGITVDGNDPIAVWRVTQESIHRARTGAGPTLIESRTWRWYTGNESSNGHKLLHPSSTRGQSDPLNHMEHYMKKRSLWNQSWRDAFATEYRDVVCAAITSLLDIA
jgi:pyruvate dehydrogenase E1 component alpha subunit